MRRIVAALLVALGIGAGAYFGAVAWAERTAAREVEARLDQWRSGGGAASRGRVVFDLWTRTLKVTDVALQSPSSPNERIAIAEVIATGIDRSGGVRRLELVGLETTHTMPGLGGVVQQKAPRVTLTDFSERPPAAPGGGSTADVMLRQLMQLAAITASAIEAPSLTVTISPPGSGSRAGPKGDRADDRTGDLAVANLAGTTEHTYSNLVLRGVADGRIAEASVDSVALRGSAGRASRGFTGEMANVSVRDIDLAPVLAWLDSSRPKEDGYRRIYGQVAAGRYKVRFDDGTGVGIDGIIAEDIGLRPAKLLLDDLVFLTEVTKPGTAPPTAGQLNMLVDKMAGLYEGIHLGRLEVQGLRVDAPQGGLTVESITLVGLDNGRLAELSLERLGGQKAARPTVDFGRMLVERLEGRSARREAVRLGRMSLKALDLASLLRTVAAQIAAPGARPNGPTVGPTGGPDRAPSPLVAMLGALEGIQLMDFAAPDPATGRMIHVEAFDAAWGRPVGGIPSEARLSAKLSGPIGPTEPDPFIRALAERGIADLAISVDLGAHWNESEERVVLAPATLQIRDVVALSAKASVTHVPREMLSSDLLKVMAAAALVEVGPLELTVRDLGVVDVAAAQLAQAKGGDAGAGRALLVESVAQRAAAATPSPELQPVLDAITRFLQGKGETLSIALTPKAGSAGLQQVIEAASRDAIGALLGNFLVEARTGG
jgi:hypothetical protein